MSKMVEVDNVSMMFNLHSERIDNIKEYIIRLLKKELFLKNSGRL